MRPVRPDLPLPVRRPARLASSPGVELNDVHSRMNATRVDRVVRVDSTDAVVAAVETAREEGLAVSVSGGRHAMGGQQFRRGAVQLDTRPLARIRSFDRESGVVEVDAGIQWPGLIAGLESLQRGEPVPWSIRQKQTGADRLALGGALSANAHGRGLALRPMAGDVESFTIVDGRGHRRRASRNVNRELFSLAIGGYGLFGVIDTVALRLARRRTLERVVEVRHAEGLHEAFAERIGDGHLYGDFQFETDERSPTFLTRGLLTTYRPVDGAQPTPAARELSPEDWMRLLRLAHADKTRAFDEYVAHYRSTHGQRYASDLAQLSFYPDGYHRTIDESSGTRVPASEMITEVYVPRHRIADFLAEAARELRRAGADVIYGTVRWIERDDETFLPWARGPRACIVFNLHVEHVPEAVDRARSAFRLLIDLAQDRGGSYFLTYHRWATRAQLLRSYPEMPDFLAAKQRLDPDDRFQSEWLAHVRGLLASRPEP